MSAASQNVIGDRMTFMVICAHKSGPYAPERNVSDMDRASVVADLASGELDGVIQIIGFNPVEHICDDVTGDLMHEAAQSILADTHADDLTDWQRKFVEQVLGFDALNEHERNCIEEDAHRRSLSRSAA